MKHYSNKDSPDKNINELLSELNNNENFTLIPFKS